MTIPKLFEVLITPAVLIWASKARLIGGAVWKPILAQASTNRLLACFVLVVMMNFALVIGTIGTAISLLILFLFVLGLNVAAAIEALAASVVMVIILLMIILLTMRYFWGSGVKTTPFRGPEKVQPYFIAAVASAICSDGNGSGWATAILIGGALLLAISQSAAGKQCKCYPISLPRRFNFE